MSIADLIQKLRDHFDARSGREKLILLAGGVIVAGFILYTVFQLPFAYLDRMETLDRLIVQKEDGLKQLAEIGSQYKTLHDRVSRIESRIEKDRQGFSLLSYLEDVATTVRIRSNIVYMRPQNMPQSEGYREMAVEVKVENAPLSQIVRFLKTLEQSPHVLKIRRLHLKKRYADPNYLDAVFLLSTYEKA
jgi:type II secretory pathway component PulM